MRFTGWGISAAPSGSSPMLRRCGVACAPNRPRISRSAPGCSLSGTPAAAAAHRRGGCSGGEAARGPRVGALRVLAEVMRPGEPQPAPGERLDQEAEMLVLALSHQQLVADDERAEQATQPFL